MSTLVLCPLSSVLRPLPPAPMVIKFLCPNGHQLSAPENMAGKKGKCPKCKSAFVVPTLEEMAAAEARRPKRPPEQPAAAGPAVAASEARQRTGGGECRPPGHGQRQGAAGGRDFRLSLPQRPQAQRPAQPEGEGRAMPALRGEVPHSGRRGARAARGGSSHRPGRRGRGDRRPASSSRRGRAAFSSPSASSAKR